MECVPRARHVMRTWMAPVQTNICSGKLKERYVFFFLYCFIDFVPLHSLTHSYTHIYYAMQTFCVPGICCAKDSWMIEGGGCADGDCIDDSQEFGV